MSRKVLNGAASGDIARRLFAVLVFLATPSSAFGAEGAIVRPEYSLAPSFDYSSTLIETTLNVYDKARLDQFVTTGESITFRFPASYYQLKTNAQGGPQLSVVLYMDYRDLSPIRARKLEQSPITKEKDDLRRELIRHKIGVTVRSNYFSPGNSLLFYKRKGNISKVGEYCGLDMVDIGTEFVYHTKDLLGYPFSVTENCVSDRTVDTIYGADFYFHAKCSRVGEKNIAL